MLDKFKKRARGIGKAIVMSAALPLVGIPATAMPLSSVLVYEAIFGRRSETEPWMEFHHEDYGISLDRSDFYEENGTHIAGYKYSKPTKKPKGVVIIAHGFTGGGHNKYMPFIDVFTSNGYRVFSYDAKGNDKSEGKSIGGFPQGVIDLDYAIRHVRKIPEYQGLPIMLFGHSWGAYSVGNVLNVQGDIACAVMVAGFNEGQDMISYRSGQLIGGLSEGIGAYIDIYEKLKFGDKITLKSATEGLKSTKAGIMIIHAKDDTVVPTECGYDKFYEEFKDDPRFEFVLLDSGGHSYPFYSKRAYEYNEYINNLYSEYLRVNALHNTKQSKATFMEQNLDKKRCFEPDKALMKRIIKMYDRYAK